MNHHSGSKFVPSIRTYKRFECASSTCYLLRKRPLLSEKMEILSKKFYL